MMFDELKLRETTSEELGLSRFLDSHNFDADEHGSVLVAANTAEQAQNWTVSIKSRLPVSTIVANCKNEAARIARDDRPDVFIISQSLANGGDGLRLASNLRANLDTRQSAIILVVEDGKMETATKALDLGASDYIHAPFDPNEMVARLRSQMRRKSILIDCVQMCVTG